MPSVAPAAIAAAGGHGQDVAVDHRVEAVAAGQGGAAGGDGALGGEQSRGVDTGERLGGGVDAEVLRHGGGGARGAGER